MKTNEFYNQWVEAHNEFDVFALMKDYADYKNQRLKEEIEQLNAINLKLRASL